MPTLTDDEMIALGMNPIVNRGDEEEEDNEVADLLDSPMGQRLQYDSQGRPIITYDQLLELRKRDVQVSSYALRVYRPLSSSKQTWIIPANLYHKWYGLDYAAPGDEVGIARLFRLAGRRYKSPTYAEPAKDVPKARASRPEDELEKIEGVAPPSVKVYFCNEKYFDCPRFFDTEKGLATHWRLEHGTRPIAKRKRNTSTTPQE